MRIGIDSGGTFTDFVVQHGDGRIEWFKLRSNPAAPHEVILAGIAHAAQGRAAAIIHGSTVATNALLERKGARTAFVTTAGFEDLLEIGRQNRERLYDLTPPPRRLLVPPDRCFGVNERIHASGTVESAPDPRDLARLARRLRRAGVESVAICFLHAYRNPAHERAVLEALRETGLFVCASHEISPEFREYERASTTALNAYVGPLMQRYLSRLGRVQVMQSNGGSLTAEEAGRHAVRTILSGPAGGVIGLAAAARAAGYPRVLGFDMGGTSTDVSLVDGAPRETVEAAVDGFPVRVPMLEIHTVGAGGGSIARIDEGGLLRVGPESVGADPGPACYGKGLQPAVTDAHVVLGRISAEQLLGGGMHIDAGRSRAAIEPLARAMNVSVEAAAAGILRIANANMERAIRAVSVERGYDPRDFALLAFGGCGGLHAAEIAAELGLSTVLVPALAGALSAFGMLVADRVRDYAAGVLGQDRPERAFAALERQARRELRGANLERFADIRYRGQSYELTVPWAAAETAARFHALHRKTYGYSNDSRPLEIVTLRVRARQEQPKPEWKAPPARAGKPAERRRVFTGGRRRVLDVWRRDALGRALRHGPALVLDYGATTLIPPGWRFRCDRTGCLIVTRSQQG